MTPTPAERNASKSAAAPASSASRTGIAPESATSRLSRLLTMVPWLMNHQGIDIEQAARTLGVSRKQIEDDLSLLFVCGTPGHMPDDLIEAEWEEGHVYVRNADEIARPLRFNRDEALALTVGLRTLLEVPGLTERDAVDRALAKLVEATGESNPTPALQVAFEPESDEVLTTVRQALEKQRALHLRYLVPSRDEVTERDVDPMRLLNTDGQWYVEGWCRTAEDVRLFRLNRIERATLLTSPARVPHHARSTDLSRGFFAPSDADPSARLRLAPPAHWVADYYPCHDLERVGDTLEATFYTGDGRWLRRLLLRLGADAEVMTPARLARDVADEAERALNQYGVLSHEGSTLTTGSTETAQP